MILSWPYRRIATEEAFSVPEVQTLPAGDAVALARLANDRPAEISDEDRRKIYHRNAERIFGIS